MDTVSTHSFDTNIAMTMGDAGRNDARLNGLKGQITQGQKDGDLKKVNEAAKEFEAVFISEMLKHVFAGVDISDDPNFGGGHGEKVFNGMMVQEYGQILADRGGIGLAEQVASRMEEMQRLVDQK